MAVSDTHEIHPHVPFLYEMAISFFCAARETLDPVLQAVDGYRELDVGHDGGLAASDHVARKFAELPRHEAVHHIGACLVATTNLGLAYVHSFRILSFLTRNRDALPANAARPDLVKLFDALPAATRDALSGIYRQVGSHDFEMRISIDPLPDDAEDESSGGRDFRSMLAYWQSNGMLHDSHRSFSGTNLESVIPVFIPLRAMLVLDHILADQIAPELDQ